MPGEKILVVDDEEKITEFITSYLQKDNFRVKVAHSGKEALDLFTQYQPDLVILDLMLPDIPGEIVCRKIRNISRIPIIMLTAKVAEEDLLHGFNVGTDDYLTKPFSPRELMARVKALFKRSAREHIPLCPTYHFNNEELMIDTQKREVRCAGTIINLTPHEYDILLLFISYPQRVFTREEIISHAFDDSCSGFDRVIDAHVKNLRRKIEPNPGKPRYILTSYGVGYYFNGEEGDTQAAQEFNNHHDT
jgi:DNA-binding response OmpR family regulator